MLLGVAATSSAQAVSLQFSGQWTRDAQRAERPDPDDPGRVGAPRRHADRERRPHRRRAGDARTHRHARAPGARHPAAVRRPATLSPRARHQAVRRHAGGVIILGATSSAPRIQAPGDLLRGNRPAGGVRSRRIPTTGRVSSRLRFSRSSNASGCSFRTVGRPNRARRRTIQPARARATATQTPARLVYDVADAAGAHRAPARSHRRRRRSSRNPRADRA